MIPKIAILEDQILSPNAGRVCVELVSGQLRAKVGDQYCTHLVGRIDDKYNLETVQQLRNQSSLRLQMYCQAKSSFIGRTQAQKTVQVECELSVIVYGPGTRSDSVGDYLQACGFYLQDPEHCDCDVPYSNPHCLSSLDEGIVMTSSLQIPLSTVENFHDPSGLFDSLSNVMEMEETETPTIIETPLKR